jgi:hypothetical protein
MTITQVPRDAEPPDLTLAKLHREAVTGIALGITAKALRAGDGAVSGPFETAGVISLEERIALRRRADISKDSARSVAEAMLGNGKTPVWAREMAESYSYGHVGTRDAWLVFADEMDCILARRRREARKGTVPAPRAGLQLLPGGAA